MKAAYNDWHEVLSAEFFGPSHGLQSTVLYIDKEVERDLAEGYGLRTSLVHAVADELNWGDPERTPFSHIKNRCTLWANRASGEPPPSLPVLAVSVLAATRMETSGGMRKSNFYGRWIQLFGERLDSCRAKKLEFHFEEIAVMWEQLHKWLEATGGRNGVSTISTGDYYRKIGFPISQALVRGSDRQILTRFFASTVLQPTNLQAVSGRELLRRLCIWTTGRDRHLSPRFSEELANAAETGDSLIADLLKRLADSWDGTLHEPERERRRRAVGLQLILADQGRRLEWLADAAPGLTKTEVSLPGSAKFMLSKGYDEVYDGLEALTPSLAQLDRGVRLEGEDLVLEWVPREVVLLRKRPYFGEWVSTEYFEPGEEHWILAAGTAIHDVRAMVDGLGGRTVREVAAPVAGWKLFKGIRAVNEARFTQTLDHGGAHVHVLEPQARQHAELSGGLRIAPEYRVGAGVAGHYLRGGAPDLRLPEGEPPDGLVEVVLDGHIGMLRADPRMPFPLCLVPLDEGEHRVSVAQSSELFTVHDGLCEGLAPGAGSLGYRCADGKIARWDAQAAPPEALIRGASVPVTRVLPATELVRHAVVEATLIDPVGGVLTVSPGAVPTWMRQRGLPEEVLLPCLEIEIPDGYVWLIIRTAARWSVRALLKEPDIPAPVPRGGNLAWAYTVLNAADRLSTGAWRLYVTAAREIVRKRGER